MLHMVGDATKISVKSGYTDIRIVVDMVIIDLVDLWTNL